MAQILALDVGGKRTGMAISDESETLAFPLQTVETHHLEIEIKKLEAERKLVEIVMGMPKNLKNQSTDGTVIAERILKRLKAVFPHLKISTVDERFTSKMAMQAMVMGGMKKSDRKQKENTDKLSATLILQSFLEQKSRLGISPPSKDILNGI
jgi:putative Holliday junction resolvase